MTRFAKHKTLDMLYNKENGLVVKSPTEKIMIGRIVNDKFRTLTKEDIELCKELKYRYEVVQEESEEEESGEEEEESGEEESEEESEEEEVTRPAPVKVVPKSVSSNESEEEEEEEEPAPRASVVPVSAPTVTTPSVVPVSVPNVIHVSARTNPVDALRVKLQECITMLSTLSTDSGATHALQQQLQESQARVEELSRELTDTKKKLKNVLIAMQNDV
jgi:hypothetical protein